MPPLEPQVYACVGLRQGMSSEAVRFAATLRTKEAPRRVLSDADAVDVLRTLSEGNAKNAIEYSQWIERVAEAVDATVGNRRREAVTKIGHARLLAVAIELRGFPKTKRQELLDKWERLTFRIFGMFSKDARTKVGDYVRLAWRVIAENLKSEEVTTALHELGEGYDIDDAIKELSDTDCYDRWQEELRYFFYRYEEHLAAESGQKFSNEQWERIWEASASTSIEHICPQSKGSLKPSRNRIFVHRLGNLVLLKPGLNSKLSDNNPADKADAYQKTGLLIAQEVAAKAKRWDRDAVEQREKRLLEWARKTWGD
ncbi:MAG: HNH endonuclease [Polyangiaceae bacterium]|nr:HNH endonuclease [Polyangiaceae bacterium]